MPRFLRIETQMFPAERIAKINRDAAINGVQGVEVTLHGIPETFQYTGHFARVACAVLEGVEPTTTPPVYPETIQVGKEQLVINDIEWIDFASNINNETGVELRISTDAPGHTRQYTRDDASEAYDSLVLLESVA